MSLFSAFTGASKETAPKSEGKWSLLSHPCWLLLGLGSWHSAHHTTTAAVTGPGAPPQPSQGAQSKPVEVAQASLAHPQHHEGATDLDLYRTFSPSDVGFWTLDRSGAWVLLMWRGTPCRRAA